MRRLLERINFPIVLTVQAVILVVTFGACGFTIGASGKLNSDRLNSLVGIEISLFVLTLVCMIFTVILWVIVFIVRTHKSGRE